MTDASTEDCVFCPENGKVSVLAESSLGYAVAALRPPIDGCMLLIPKRHITSYFGLPDTWHAEEVELLTQLIKGEHMRTFSGYTPSWNLSEITGRQIPHLHHWWIPRFDEDPESVAYHLGAATLIGHTRKARALHML